MAYTPTNWTNFPSTATPVNASNLNKIENELVALDTGKADESAVTTALAGKVDKVEGKGLSTEDFTTAEKTKLAGISAEANKVEITPVVTEGTTLATISIDGVDTAIKGSDIDVDSAMSPTSENPVQNKVIYEELQNILPEETAEGNPISITDASGLNAKSCEVTMNPIQDLHGQSAPYPAGGGKNKLPFDLATIKANNTAGTWNGNNYTYNGVTWTVNDDGTYIANNTATGGVSVLLIIGNNSQSSSAVNLSFPSTDYKITTGFTIDGTNTTYEIGYRPTGSSGAAKHIYNNNGYALLSTDINLIQLVIREGYTANNIKFEPMIVPSTESDYTFIPYSNICPISGRDSVDVVVTGKNLFNATIEQGGIYSSGGKSNRTDRCRTETAMRIKSNTEYTVSVGGDAILTGIYFYISETINALTFSSRMTGSGKTLTFTAPSEGGYVAFTFAKSDTSSDITPSEVIEPMFEFGSTPTAYEPYKGQTHTETFTNTVYGGKVDFVSGKLILTHLLFTLNGSEEGWAQGGTVGDTRRYVISLGINFNDEIGKSACNYLIQTTGNSGEWGTYRMIAPNLIVKDKNANFASISDFKTYLSTNNLQVLVELATPTEITLTPETIALLKGNNVLWADGDSVKLVYSADIKSYIAEQLSSLS